MTCWLIKSDCSQLLVDVSACSRMNELTSQILHKRSLNCRRTEGQISRASQKWYAVTLAKQTTSHLPSQGERDFYWPTFGASRSRREVNQYQWLRLSSLPFKIHELLGNKATAAPDPCWKRFWSLFSAKPHPWMLSDGWQCPGCIICKDYNGLVSPHQEQNC